MKAIVAANRNQISAKQRRLMSSITGNETYFMAIIADFKQILS